MATQTSTSAPEEIRIDYEGIIRRKQAEIHELGDKLRDARYGDVRSASRAQHVAQAGFPHESHQVFSSS